jgi:phospholipase/carboxylesterase
MAMLRRPVTPRVRRTIALAVLVVSGGCAGPAAEHQGGAMQDRTPGTTSAANTARADAQAAREGRLRARPDAGPAAGGTAGLHRLDVGARGALLSVPDGHDPAVPAPLAVMLHGAGGEAEQGLGLFGPLAAERGLLVLAVASAGRTWDVIGGDYGPDVAAVDEALRLVFDRYAVDPARLAVGGFSDGASYALSLGLTNGDLFSHVIAFSPGFMAPASTPGEPRIFVSHGVHDRVLPIDRCSRRLVPALQGAGYDVHYREFDGDHAVPAPIAREGLDWFLTAAG